jgi:YggT family protein
LDISLIFLFVQKLFWVLKMLLFARVIVSFLPMFMNVNPYNPIIRFVHETTEPLMAPFRKIIPPVGGLDFSLLIVWLVLQLVENLVMELLQTVLT